MGPPAAPCLSPQPEGKGAHENALLALAVRKKQLEKMIFSPHKLFVFFCDLSVFFMLRMFFNVYTLWFLGFFGFMGVPSFSTYLKPIENLGLKKRKRWKLQRLQKHLLCLVALRRAVLASELAVYKFLFFFNGFTHCGG